MKRAVTPLLTAALVLGAANEALAKKVTPWLEYEKHAPLIDIPHAFLSSPYREIVRVRVGGQWREAINRQGISGFHHLEPTPFDGGRAVLVRDGDALIFREGVEAPIKLKWDACPWPEVSQDCSSLLCMFVEDEYGSSGARSHVLRVRLEHRDSTGALVDSLPIPVPKTLAEAFPFGATLIGWDARGTPVLEGQLFSEKAGMSTFVAFALEAPLARELVRRGPKSGAPEWSRLIPGLVLKHRGAD